MRPAHLRALRRSGYASASMRFRTYINTNLTVSEVGFGMWTISTGWWGNYTEGEALALMHKAFDFGITLFDAADTYGNGLSEEYIAKAFPNNRDEIVIAKWLAWSSGGTLVPSWPSICRSSRSSVFVCESS